MRDGMGLEDKNDEHKKNDKEPILAIAELSACGSEAEGSAVGNFEGLKPPERKRKAGRPTTSRDKPPYDDRGARSKKYKGTIANGHNAERCGTSKRTRFCSICREPGHKSTTCPLQGDAPRKERKEAKYSNYGRSEERV